MCGGRETEAQSGRDLTWGTEKIGFRVSCLYGAFSSFLPPCPHPRPHAILPLALNAISPERLRDPLPWAVRPPLSPQHHLITYLYLHFLLPELTAREAFSMVLVFIAENSGQA